jgi:hypothetical protein
MGRLTGGAEGFADLSPGHAFLVAGQGDVGVGEAIGGGGDAGGRDGEEEVTGACRGIPALSTVTPRAERKLVDDFADEGVGSLVAAGGSGWATTGHGLEDTGKPARLSGNS